MSFADAGRAEEQNIFGFTDELAHGQLVNVFLVNGGVEAPVEVVQRFECPKVGCFGVASEHPLLSHIQFVLQDQLQELTVAEAIGAGFLQPHRERLRQAGEPELFKGRFKVGWIHYGSRVEGCVFGAKQTGTRFW